MLHCNMITHSASEQHALEDLLGDLQYARRQGDLGRLALLAYCEVRRWARNSGEADLAEHSSEMINSCPHASRDEFMRQVDVIIHELELACARVKGQVAEATH